MQPYPSMSELAELGKRWLWLSFRVIRIIHSPGIKFFSHPTQQACEGDISPSNIFVSVVMPIHIHSIICSHSFLVPTVVWKLINLSLTPIIIDKLLLFQCFYYDSGYVIQAQDLLSNHFDFPLYHHLYPGWLALYLQPCTACTTLRFYFFLRERTVW